MTALPGAAADLYGLAPTEFVAGRNALVKELKRAKHADDAAVVAALRRPSVAEHAVNAAARADPERAQRWAAAVLAVAEAQSSAISGGAPGALRDTTTTLRAETGHLADAAVSAIGDEAKRNDILAVLRGATTRPGATLVVQGILGAADPDDELFAGAAEPAGSAPGRARAGTSRSTDTDDEADASAAADAKADASADADADADARAMPRPTTKASGTRARVRAVSPESRPDADGSAARVGSGRLERAAAKDTSAAEAREAARTAAAERAAVAAGRAAERLAAADVEEVQARVRLDAARQAVEEAHDALRAAEAALLAAQRDVRRAADQTAAAKKAAARASRQ
jgi:hypothetical protein